MIDVKGFFSLKMQSRLLGISMTVITRQAAKKLYRKITGRDAMWRVKVLMGLHVQWKWFVTLDYNQFVDLRGLFCCLLLFVVVVVGGGGGGGGGGDGDSGGGGGGGGVYTDLLVGSM